MTEMITNISDPHFFIEVKSKKKTCLRHVMQTFSFLFIIPRFFKKAKGILLSPPSVCLSVRPIVMLSPPKPLGCLGVKNQIPSCCLSVMLSPPKPLDEIQPNLE